jgi:hypothetical protein
MYSKASSSIFTGPRPTADPSDLTAEVFASANNSLLAIRETHLIFHSASSVRKVSVVMSLTTYSREVHQLLAFPQFDSLFTLNVGLALA